MPKAMRKRTRDLSEDLYSSSSDDTIIIPPRQNIPVPIASTSRSSVGRPSRKSSRIPRNISSQPVQQHSRKRTHRSTIRASQSSGSHRKRCRYSNDRRHSNDRRQSNDRRHSSVRRHSNVRRHRNVRRHSNDRRRFTRRSNGTAYDTSSTDTTGESDNSNISQYDSEPNMYSSSSVSDSEPYTPPIIPFGSKAGESASKSIIKNITRDKFIELSDILPMTETENTNTPNSYLQLDQNIRVIQNNRHKALTFQQWSCAFNNFTVIYLKTHPQRNTTDTVNLTQNLITYHNNIANLMKQGGDWAGYDRHFRKLRETNSNISWGTMVLDLQLHYSRHNYQRVSHTKQHNSFSNKRPDYCYRYNTQGQICKIPAC